MNQLLIDLAAPALPLRWKIGIAIAVVLATAEVGFQIAFAVIRRRRERDKGVNRDP